MIYVDELMAVRAWPRARMVRCHLVSDNLEELHQFASKVLEIPRSAFNHPPLHNFPHYRISTLQRDKAIEYGAVVKRHSEIAKIADNCGFKLTHERV